MNNKNSSTFQKTIIALKRSWNLISVGDAGLANFSFLFLQGEEEGAAAMVPSDDEGEMEDMKARLEALRS